VITKILYISYDGLTDPVGQSQIIPYLTDLSKLGFEITIISAEKKEAFVKNNKSVKQILSVSKINWKSINYHKSPPIISTILDIYLTNKLAQRLHKKNQYNIVHCRSYIASFTGLYLKKRYPVKFIFDMRGFWADERIDGNLWNKKNVLFKSIFNYFKKKELAFLKFSDCTISLTHSAKQILLNDQQFQGINKKIEVIPCCADLQHFSPKKVDNGLVLKLKDKLKITDSDYIISYLGSIGTWYMLDEMLKFFNELLMKRPNAKFLFITLYEKQLILDSASKLGIASKNLIIQGGIRDDIPTLLSLSQVSLFFIKPVFSKKASSPIKLAEILGMGIPVIANAGIGDMDEVLEKNNCGILIRELNTENYRNAITQIETLNVISKENIKSVAKKYFSLSEGVVKYKLIYQNFA